MADELSSRERLIGAATMLIRRQGYVATSVGDVCREAGVSKGAFFHHFESKEALVSECLSRWNDQLAAMHESAPFASVEDPVERLVGYMDFMIGVFGDPTTLKSCLAGMAAQEISTTHPVLREGANRCFVEGMQRLASMLEAACASSGREIDAASLAGLWLATLQGALVVAKASGDDSSIPEALTHVKRYIEGQVRPEA